MRGATESPLSEMYIPSNFNPRSPCGERPECRATIFSPSRNFNPRSPCGERLKRHFMRLGLYHTISIHAPRAGSDRCIPIDSRIHSNFNPRSPCGERLRWHKRFTDAGVISIHAPRAGSDNGYEGISPISVLFQSTLPVRGATGSSASSISSI